MIVDKLENACAYKSISARMAKAFEILKDESLINKEDGRYDIDGDNIYYMVQRYQTMPVAEGKLEAHKNYIDVQYVVKGQELMGYAPLNNLKIETPYDSEKDFILYEPSDEFSTVKLTEGMFCVLYPQDTHMPCRAIAEPIDVHKIVIKIKI